MLKTEMRNGKTMHIDKMDTLSMVRVINEESKNAVAAVEKAEEAVAKTADAVAEAFKKGGRLFYIGAGTSGRLAVLDAAECPPTFGVSYDLVVAIIAGGEKAMVRAAEGAEDSYESGVADLSAHNPTKNDVVVGISAAGGAPYVIGALEKAKEVGAVAVSLSCNEDCPISKVADIAICTDTGAEVITGSTRMKAGTAQKLVLNTISTCAMVKMGYVYENMMINLRPTNVKLKQRMIRIAGILTGENEEEAEKLLEENEWDLNKLLRE